MSNYIRSPKRNSLKEGERRNFIKAKSNSWIKKAIWVYFILLIFEGALRKWVFPELATLLLIVRDPIGIWLLINCYKNKLFKINIYVFCMWFVGFASFLITIAFGHGNIFVALFGLRTLILHFPLIFIIGWGFDKTDVINLGKVLIWLTLPMTILTAIQFYSPQSDWVNRGVGGDMEGAGFGGALGYFRPPGTFSFTSGLTSFYGLVSAYIFYFWLGESKAIKKWILILATVSLAAALPLSISRTLFFEIILSILFALLVVSKKPKYLIRTIYAFIGGIVLLIILSNFNFFQTSVEVFTNRFESANESEGGTKGVLVDRFLGGLYGAIVDSEGVPIGGYGLGMGTNTGAVILKGERYFLLPEQEWGRIIGEMGILLGFSVILLRCSLAVEMTRKSFSALSQGNILPWMLLSYGFLTILQGQWAQPTSLGFTVLSGGLVLASLRHQISSRKIEERNS